MATDNYLPEVLELTECESMASGFIFTEGPLWQFRASPQEPMVRRLSAGGNWIRNFSSAILITLQKAGLSEAVMPD